MPLNLLNERLKSLMKIQIKTLYRKTLLFNEGRPWVKKERNDNFDVPMGCFNGTEVCDLVGSYILKQPNQLSEHYSVVLYKDDGLAILKSLSGPKN